MAGDFNATVRASERKGGSEAYERREFAGFCQFIYEMDLIDIPVLGKKISWFSGDGRVKSRLDRLLLIEELISSWQVTAQWIGNRDNSDHCPIWIDCLTLDWGPKPFRFNNCWLGHKDFKVFVEDCWKSFNVRGWKMFAFKEKLKLLREKLREWNEDIFYYMDLNIKNIVQEINVLDDLVDASDFQQPERRKELSSLFWQQVHAKESLIKQKTRCKWIAERDVNTRYFHACVRGRRRRNQLLALKKGDFWIKGVHEIKSEVKNHFQFFLWKMTCAGQS